MVKVQIGQSGTFVFAPPFDVILNHKLILTCVSISTIQERESSGDDILNKVYIQNGLSKIDYDDDKTNGIPIVNLYAKGAGWVSVPCDRIVSEPSLDGVQYHTLTLAAGLGAIDANRNLTELSTELSDLIYTRLGIKPDIQYVQTSDPFLVSFSEHERILETRDNIATVKKSTIVRLLETEKLLNEALLKIKRLESFIIENHSKP